jgi:hypothetical protein
MNHKYKTILFNVIALLPNTIGDFCYHKIKNNFDKESLESKLKRVDATYLRLSIILNRLNIDLKDKVVYELGSGWFPAMPYFFLFKFQVKKVLTFDINKHFNVKTILELNHLFAKIYNCTITVKPTNNYRLPADIDYFPNCNILEQEIHNADIVFSRYVLSHMNEIDVVEFHKKLKNSLKKGSHIIHFISPSDLRQHGDDSISTHDFLKYSKSEWNKIHTKFDYHNRIRLPQFLEVFNNCGLELLHLDFEVLNKETKQFELFKKLIIHHDFKKYSDDELTAGNILVILKV